LPTRVTREALLERLTGCRPPIVVEALGAAFYADAHLPGAINIPPGQVDRLSAELLPDRDAEIVVYCTGACSSSDAVARHLEALGYGSVAVYGGGKEDWVEHGLQVERSDAADTRL
jgi:rhodanese-related sulfurtransferase